MSQEWQFATKTHIPVMPKEVLSHLNVQKDGVYVDGTIGLGGTFTINIIPIVSKRASCRS